jgi:hypothetical protein
MTGSYLLAPAILAILFAFLVVRAAAIALMMTGLDGDRARFQALSAFTGTGFTTREAESIVNHPKRRKIVSWLMITGNAGIVTVIVTATSSFVTSPGVELPISVAILLVGIFIVYRIARHRGVVKKWDVFIEGRLSKSKAFKNAPTEDLLHFGEGYGLVREIVTTESPLADRSLVGSRLSSKGLLVLGIERGPSWIPIPKADETMRVGDRVVVYGPLDVLKALIR